MAWRKEGEGSITQRSGDRDLAAHLDDSGGRHLLQLIDLEDEDDEAADAVHASNAVARPQQLLRL